MPDQLSVTEKCRRAMVIAMEEGCQTLVSSWTPMNIDRLTQRFLLQNQEDSIEKFQVFCQIVQLQDLADCSSKYQLANTGLT